MNGLYTDIRRNLLDVFNEYSVQIMTPVYEGDPSEPKVVPKERWFTAPAKPQISATARLTPPSFAPDQPEVAGARESARIAATR